MSGGSSKAHGAKAGDSAGAAAGRHGRWSAGPPQLARAQKDGPGGSRSPRGRAPAGGARGLIDGEAPDQVEAMHGRLLCLLTHLVGTQVEVTTTGGDVYQGVLCSINPNDAQSVVLRYAYAQGGGKAAPPVGTLVINGDDCLSIAGVAAWSDGGAGGGGGARGAFKTDADISRAGAQAAQRELHRWVPDDGDDLGALGSGLEDAGPRSWDQFATNERLFGLTTDFDEEIYTTRLDRSRADFKEREREAARIAHEIQSAPFFNSHVAEERHDVAADDGGAMDEEDRYGAVLRPSGAPGKYVPPYLRGKPDPARPDTAPAPGDAEPPTRPAAAEPARPPNNAMAAAALAKLNIRTTGHSPAPGGSSSGGAPKSAARDASPSPAAAVAAAAAAAAATADPAIIAASKPPAPSASGKLASLRGNKHRTDVAALNKPMADITEKLNSERERIHQHKQALLKNCISELVKFQKSFKLNTPMPDDVAELVGVKKKAVGKPPPEAPAASAAAKAAEGLAAKAAEGLAAKAAEGPAAKAAASGDTGAPAKGEPGPDPEPQPQKATSPGSSDASASAQAPAADEGAREPKKPAFKFNAKASSFKPSAAASPFVPKHSASSSRASSAAGASEYNAFFGRRTLKKAPLPLWGGAFKLPKSCPSGDGAPTWPFGSRTYRIQFVPDGPEAMMYPLQGYMAPYGYYQHYQYPPPHMGMIPPGGAPRVAASSPYMAAAAAGYGAPGGGGVYAGGPYSSTPGYPSPVVAAAGRSPVPAAIGGPPLATPHPLPGAQGGGSGVDQHSAATPEPPHIAQAGSDIQGPMYGTAPIHMSMVPPHMQFGGMHAGAYMAPSVPPPQGYPPQSVPMPMGYAHYPPGQPYGASPPGMAMAHGSPHPEHGAPGTASHHAG
ncbi:poly(A)-binding protein binding protein [Coemansia javaensis]|uniref:Poly(A)-binding protein binding protein n=1 Tax=Coemansia javaensis TaxID=2761396 RepID=A0A9W8LGH8_9FUNG|nr:poly(A)-binding protein binding protein [Coemansia javaensis]